MKSCVDFQPRPSGKKTLGTVALYAALLLAAVFLIATRDGSALSEGGVQVVLREVTALPVLAEAALGAADKTGTLKGVVTFEGTPPKRDPLVAKGDQSVKDAAVCSVDAVPDESFLVNEESKGIANVFIFLEKAPAAVKPPQPKEKELVFDQKGCRFIPHVLCIQVGQKVIVKSDDAVPHNTHTHPFRNSGFNQTIAANDRKGVELIYTRPERIPVEVRCDFHKWMVARHMVLDHPYMAVTDSNGQFEIQNLPAGNHKFKIWQEKDNGRWLEKELAVEIKPGVTTELTLKYDAAKFAGPAGARGRVVEVASGSR
jgi:plastocyanin